MNKSDNFIIGGILANNDFGITKVTELQSLHTGLFVQSDYSLIEKLIMQKKI